MFPELIGIDHIHVYVKDREKAAAWYKDVLGFVVNKELEVWAKDKHGPLTIEDPGGNIHLALFYVENHTPSTAIAFKADGKAFLEWKSYLEKAGILLRCADHQISWSLYFNDLDGNMHEITTYQYQYVSDSLSEIKT
ncbi:VOC family protein [Porticoccaceae bacterium LTM1]|nr:VOC family protein [Porticoccaceae bacterium LTM1]